MEIDVENSMDAREFDLAGEAVYQATKMKEVKDSIRYEKPQEVTKAHEN